MPAFSYSAVDGEGRERSGALEAPDARQAAVVLRGRGLYPTRLDEREPTVSVARPAAAARSGGLILFGAVSAKERAAFTRQLGTLLRAGMPLLRGLEVLGRQTKNPLFAKVLAALADGIRSGETLSEVMGRHPRAFDRLYVSMIRAGEAGGLLDIVLERLAQFQEKSLQVRGKVKAAMVYPFIVLGVAVAILVALLVFVVPKFQQIFADLLKGAPLPALTQAVLTASELVRHHVLFVIGSFVAAALAFRYFRRSVRGAMVTDTLIVRLPLFGELFLKAVVARFARTLGTLLSSGVPILPALLITRDTCANVRIAAAIQAVHDRVKEGASVARPLEATGVFPPMVASMIEVGEHSGQLPEMLNKVADIYEGEVDNAVAGLSSLIDPILILFLAVVVGTIVIALFLPIIRIVQMLT
ncbi:MAG: type pilus assembly protein PilC [Verrucomicrobiota bacterium]|nr:type pilus assembly protein PilC [Verrucomicrobiota bacterium]